MIGALMITIYLKERKTNIGFTKNNQTTQNRDKYTNQELINYGLMPELIGRMSNIFFLNQLTDEDLTNILLHSKISPLLLEQARIQKEFHVNLRWDQSYIQEIRKKKNVRNYRIGNAIEVIDKTNKDGSPYEVLGLNNNKMFMPTVASMDTINTSKYKIIRKGEFAFSGMQTGRDKCIRIALYDKDIPALISPAYATFILDKEEPILPEYFMMIFKNPEMDRLGWFYSDSSVRANLDWNRFIDIEIPLPPIEVQQAIVNIYKCANEAKLIAEEADRLSREVCPALLQHVIHS